MSAENIADRRSRWRDILDQLIHEKQIIQYGLFGVTSEGKELPDGSESASGFVVADTGAVFSFWLDWNEAEHRPRLTTWKSVRPAPDWAEDDEYNEALRAAGVR